MISKKKLEERKRKWGTYLPEYIEREEIKHLVYNNNHKSSGGDNIEKYRDLYVYTYWARSLEANDFDLEHPNFYEYKEYFKIKDVSWLRLGYSYVNMIAYKKWKKDTNYKKERQYNELAKDIIKAQKSLWSIYEDNKNILNKKILEELWKSTKYLDSFKSKCEDKYLSEFKNGLLNMFYGRGE